MANDEMTADQDALHQVYTRNHFYKQRFHLSLGVMLFGLAIIGVLSGTLYFLLKKPPSPMYFVTDGSGRLIQDVPLNKPNMSNEDVSDWVKEAVQKAYSYDFQNYRGQLQEAEKYFTDYGWKGYMQGLQSSDNLIALTQRKWVVIAQAVSDPKLIGTKQLGKAGIYAWKYEIPLLVSYYGPPYDDHSRIDNPLKITVIVERQSVLSSYKGLGIVQMIGEISQ